MLLGIGVDVVHTPRITALLARRGSQRLAARILSQEEFTQWESLPLSNHIRFLAVRWGIKEAAYKAMYPAVRPTWKELTYNGLGQGQAGQKPALFYQPRVPMELSKIGHIHISVSHDGDYIFATVIVENPIKS